MSSSHPDVGNFLNRGYSDSEFILDLSESNMRKLESFLETLITLSIVLLNVSNEVDPSLFLRNRFTFGINSVASVIKYDDASVKSPSQYPVRVTSSRVSRM